MTAPDRAAGPLRPARAGCRGGAGNSSSGAQRAAPPARPAASPPSPAGSGVLADLLPKRADWVGLLPPRLVVPSFDRRGPEARRLARHRVQPPALGELRNLATQIA